MQGLNQKQKSDKTAILISFKAYWLKKSAADSLVCWS